MWPIWWLVLKSPEQGAQTFLYAAMEAEFARGEGGVLLKECKVQNIYRDEITDEEKQKMLWEVSEKAIEALEKEGAMVRAKEKRQNEDKNREKQAEQEQTISGMQGKKEGSRRSRKAA